MEIKIKTLLSTLDNIVTLPAELMDVLNIKQNEIYDVGITKNEKNEKQITFISKPLQKDLCIKAYDALDDNMTFLLMGEDGVEYVSYAFPYEEINVIKKLHSKDDFEQSFDLAGVKISLFNYCCNDNRATGTVFYCLSKETNKLLFSMYFRTDFLLRATIGIVNEVIEIRRLAFED